MKCVSRKHAYLVLDCEVTPNKCQKRTCTANHTNNIFSLCERTNRYLIPKRVVINFQNVHLRDKTIFKTAWCLQLSSSWSNYTNWNNCSFTVHFHLPIIKWKQKLLSNLSFVIVWSYSVHHFVWVSIYIFLLHRIKFQRFYKIVYGLFVSAK